MSISLSCVLREQDKAPHRFRHPSAELLLWLPRMPFWSQDCIWYNRTILYSPSAQSTGIPASQQGYPQGYPSQSQSYPQQSSSDKAQGSPYPQQGGFNNPPYNQQNTYPSYNYQQNPYNNANNYPQQPPYNPQDPTPAGYPGGQRYPVNLKWINTLS